MFNLLMFDYSSGTGIYEYDKKVFILSYPYINANEINRSQLSYYPYAEERVIFPDKDSMVRYFEILYMNDKYQNSNLKLTKLFLGEMKLNEKSSNLSKNIDILPMPYLDNRPEKRVGIAKLMDIKNIQTIRAELRNNFLPKDLKTVAFGEEDINITTEFDNEKEIIEQEEKVLL